MASPWKHSFVSPVKSTTSGRLADIGRYVRATYVVLDHGESSSGSPIVLVSFTYSGLLSLFPPSTVAAFGPNATMLTSFFSNNREDQKSTYSGTHYKSYSSGYSATHMTPVAHDTQ
nr:hypothetical protein HmN_000957900 [Hymenolepis microstoma]